MYIERNKSNLLRAIAIIMVLIGHGFSWLLEGDFYIFEWAGGLGVAIFLIISGYGLTESYKAIGLRGFWKKRIISVMVPYWCVMLGQSFFDFIFFNRKMSVVEWTISFIGYNDYKHLNGIDSTMWYITYIMICYVIFFLIFSIPTNDIIKGALLFAIFVIGFKQKLYLTDDWYFNYFSFPLGCFISIYKGKINEKIKNTIIALSLLIFLVFSSGIYIGRIPTPTIILVYCISGGVFFVGLEYSKVILESKLFRKIGDCSYFIYLLEGYIINKFPLIEGMSGNYLEIILFWIITIELSLFCKCIYLSGINKIKDKIGKMH